MKRSPRTRRKARAQRTIQELEAQCKLEKERRKLVRIEQKASAAMEREWDRIEWAKRQRQKDKYYVVGWSTLVASVFVWAALVGLFSLSPGLGGAVGVGVAGPGALVAVYCFFQAEHR